MVPLLNRCEKCDLAYSAYQMYKNHMDQFHKKSLTCDECGLKVSQWKEVILRTMEEDYLQVS